MSKLRKYFITTLIFFTISSFCAVYADNVLVTVEEPSSIKPVVFTTNVPSPDDDEIA